jgi:hypothetical protein
LSQSIAMDHEETTASNAVHTGLITFDYVRQRYGPTLQAGGHRFDPGWLHRRKSLETAVLSRGQMRSMRGAAAVKR